MLNFKVLKCFFIIGILIFCFFNKGQVLAKESSEVQKGTLMVKGEALTFEKNAYQLVVRDGNGKILFQWKPENKNTELRGFDYSAKHQRFVLLLEVFDTQKKTYSLICQGPTFKENIQSDVDTPFREAVYFEMEDGSEWVVFLSKASIVSYYSFASKRLLAKERYKVPVLGIAKDKIDGGDCLILKNKEKGNIIRRFKRQFIGAKPYNNPLLPIRE